jgi:mycofactocin precursor
MDLERDTTPAGTDTLVADAQPEELLDDELLVEEISIDGMCGVY